MSQGFELQVNGDGINTPYTFVYTNPLQQFNNDFTPPPLIIQNGYLNSPTNAKNELLVTMPTPFPTSILFVLVSGYVSMGIYGSYYSRADELLVPIIWNNLPNQSPNQFTVSGLIPEGNMLTCFHNFGFNLQYIAYGY